MKDRYVILTGSKNNAGDYLIKYRAKKLLTELRPDREVIDLDRWKPLSAEQVELINDSRALLLTGGPALRPDMYPVIYPLTANLDDIKVPVIMMGLGYKDHIGTWENTANYTLSDPSRQLLKKIDSSGFLSSVRDYHTLNVLLRNGFKNVTMTGCPALYDTAFIGREPQYDPVIRKVAFSLGVTYQESPAMDKLMKGAIRSFHQKFGNGLTVFFHHTINKAIPAQAAMTGWLEKEKIAYKDISGSVEGLLEAYSSTDLHAGFRVHSHIYTCSISKPSMLFAEDGRAKALYTVIGGLILDAYRIPVRAFHEKIAGKIGMSSDPFIALGDVVKDGLDHIAYEAVNGFPRMRMTRSNIDQHFELMKRFLKQLP
jgi:hypothetical protein